MSQAYKIDDADTPDIDADTLIKFFNYISNLRDEINVLSYHDRSDGGLLATLCEMAFAGRCGLKVQINSLGADAVANLFNEELGAVLQIGADDLALATTLAAELGLGDYFHVLGEPTSDKNIIISFNDSELLNKSRKQLELIWSQPSYQIQSLRDNPETAEQELSLVTDDGYGGLQASAQF